MPEASANPAALATAIKQHALALGFDLVGIAPAAASPHRPFVRQWLDDGCSATMDYLAKRFDERTDVRVYVPGAQSVICVAVNYHVTLPPPPPGSRGRLARYAWGDDYHVAIKGRLHQLADWLREQAGDAVTRCCVDTAPVLERELAARAGLGWIGKNGCLIHPRLGSWLLLGELITTLPLPPDEPLPDRCGTCRRCMDACPTRAITAPRRLDARRCISYLTIEHRGEIDSDLRACVSPWIFGCDLCQEACPWNRRAPEATDPSRRPHFADGTLDIDAVLRWTPAEYAQALRGTAVKRVKLPQLQRNAMIVAGR